MIFMRETSITRAIGRGGGPEMFFFVPEMTTSEASGIWPPKSRDFQGPPSHSPSNGFASIKTIILQIWESTVHDVNRF
jgi:hypothetical protein